MNKIRFIIFSTFESDYLVLNDDQKLLVDSYIRRLSEGKNISIPHYHQLKDPFNLRKDNLVLNSNIKVISLDVPVLRPDIALMQGGNKNYNRGDTRFIYETYTDIDGCKRINIVNCSTHMYLDYRYHVDESLNGNTRIGYVSHYLTEIRDKYTIQ